MAQAVIWVNSALVASIASSASVYTSSCNRNPKAVALASDFLQPLHLLSPEARSGSSERQRERQRLRQREQQRERHRERQKQGGSHSPCILAAAREGGASTDGPGGAHHFTGPGVSPNGRVAGNGAQCSDSSSSPASHVPSAAISGPFTDSESTQLEQKSFLKSLSSAEYWPSHLKEFPGAAHAREAARRGKLKDAPSTHFSGRNALEKGSRVAVVGAGVSGMVSAKLLMEAGYEVTVFEAREKIGGIWARTYASTSLQTPRIAYRFSDWEWPDSAPMNPSHREVVEYLQGYANHFGVYNKIRFNTRIVEMQEAEGSERGWRLRVKGGESGGRDGETELWLHYDFVVMCCGCFSGVPHIPKFESGKGLEAFKGTTMHSAQYSELDEAASRSLLHGKKVVVVGFQKTAIDVVLESAEINRGSESAQSTLLFRKTHWLVPRDQMVCGVHLKYILLTRFVELFFPYPQQGILRTILQKLVPVRQVLNSMVERYLKQRYPLEKYNLIPSHSFHDDVSACILPQLPPTFFPLVEEGSIRLQKSATWHFTSAGIALEDGRQLEADVVVLCTGYDGLGKLRGLLPPHYGSKLASPGQSLSLYRGVLHPRIPNMAFIGFHEGLSSMHSAEMGARWLSKLLQGAFSLPEAVAMEAECSKWWTFKNSQTPFAGRVSCVAPIHMWHFDALCRDMGWDPMRKKGFVANWFTPHGSVDYVETAPSVRDSPEEEKLREREELLPLTAVPSSRDVAKPNFGELVET